eukprot:scaffold60431_cov35-Tisochrysis_lutea.AAC.1
MRLAEQQTRRLGRTDPSIMPQLSRSGDRPEMLVPSEPATQNLLERGDARVISGGRHRSTLLRPWWRGRLVVAIGGVRDDLGGCARGGPRPLPWGGLGAPLGR